MRPTYRNLTESFEGWAYRSGFSRQIAELERRDFIEKHPDVGNFICRLTDRGRLHALGGRDPKLQWSRAWDRHWRFILFDVPVSKNSARARLARYLRGRGFGCLQKSVWVSPDPLI